MSALESLELVFPLVITIETCVKVYKSVFSASSLSWLIQDSIRFGGACNWVEDDEQKAESTKSFTTEASVWLLGSCWGAYGAFS